MEPFATEARRFVSDAQAHGQQPTLTETLHHLDHWAESHDLVHDLATKKFAISTFVTALLKS